jgi:hypothetical protein
MALYLSVITSCMLKWSINPISNPKPRRESLILVTLCNTQLFWRRRVEGRVEWRGCASCRPVGTIDRECCAGGALRIILVINWIPQWRIQRLQFGFRIRDHMIYIRHRKGKCEYRGVRHRHSYKIHRLTSRIVFNSIVQRSLRTWTSLKQVAAIKMCLNETRLYSEVSVDKNLSGNFLLRVI